MPTRYIRYIALIPAYEPDRRMMATTAALGKEGMDIVLVDDGSGCGYADIFEQAAEKLPGRSGCSPMLLIHDENKGKGAALKTGLDFIRNFLVRKSEEERTVIVTVDADGQHLAQDAVRIAAAAADAPGTLVLGSRNLGKTPGSLMPGDKDLGRTAVEPAPEIPLRSRIGNAVTRQVFRLATGVPIYDTQTGLRAFTADLIPELLAVRGERYEYELNVLMEFTRRGIPVRETGIETVYIDGNSSSHFQTVRDSWRIYRGIGRFRMKGSPVLQAVKFSASSFISFTVDYAMYTLMLLAGMNLIPANITARIISAAANFTINRRLVFRSDKELAESALQYFALAAFILAGNTAVLQTLAGTLGINEMIAKIVTEMLFFAISWTVQKYVVFHKVEAAQDGDGRIGLGSCCSESASDPSASEFVIEYSAVRPGKLRSVRRRRRQGA